ncbi:MAG TPA: acetaldehyde dehydrogenase [Acidobacteria bacterium]|nr:acetaldehyde dehydrogenase [Acidobacteriota bacterium]
MVEYAAQTDPDLDSIRNARTLARRAHAAQSDLAELSQEQIDRVVEAMAAAATAQAVPFARMAVDETGMGLEADKARKNRFASETIYRFIQPMRTVGVIRRNDQARVVEIAEPFGVVAAIVPTTNPTSTAIYKILVCMKARCALVISPHPAAAHSVERVAEIMAAAASEAGAPAGSINCMTNVTLEGTQELMRRKEVSVVLATGGLGLVRAAYSAGKPAYGVGPGNAPAYIERTADLTKAVSDVITGKTFDNGLLCSSENSVVVDDCISGEVRREFERQGGHFLNQSEAERLAEVLVTPDRLPSTECVGRTALEIASLSDITAPDGTRVLIASLNGVGRDYPLSMEKLCPVLSFYVVPDWRAACTRCQEILRYGGMGHTMSIHSQDEHVILEFGLKKPAFRIVVNTPTTLGSIGMTTGLDPSMTLGCGGYGGNITSDNITPHHLLNIKRLAYEIRPETRSPVTIETPPPASSLDVSPKPPMDGGIDSTLLATRIESFLASRGLAKSTISDTSQAPGEQAKETPLEAVADPPRTETAAEFVCEEDVRQAVQEKRTIVIGARTIVTPAAHDLGAQHRIFVQIDLAK